jgi:hypothetical protein
MRRAFRPLLHPARNYPGRAPRVLGRKGCQSCWGKEVEKKPVRAQISSAFRDILGDDVDGIAAEMEDVESMLGKGFWE